MPGPRTQDRFGYRATEGRDKMWAVSRRNARATIALGAVLAAAVLVPSFKASNAAADPPGCFSGAHSLSKFGDRVYPEMGNGGYTSLHTDVFLNYDAPTNMFLSGTHVDLQVSRRSA